MLQLKPMDHVSPIQAQLGLETGPVSLINLFTVDKDDEAALLQAWTVDAEFMRIQPGFIFTQLYKAIGEESAYLNHAIWESNATFRAAFTHPEFQSKLSDYPSSAIASPHLFEKIAVPGICVA